jgi:hypothetical protein
MKPLAARLTARLDSQRPRSRSRHRSGETMGAEPLAIRHAVTDSFGVLGLGVGEHTIFDVLDYMKLGDYRVAALGKALASISGVWSVKDPGGYADFQNDLNGLIMRWAAAKTKAQSVSSVLGGYGDATAEYNGMVQALRQSAPPDGGPIHKGDYQDLVERISKAGGRVDEAQTPQPTAPDLGLGINRLLAPVDYAAMVRGDEAPKGPGADAIGDLHKLYLFWKAHHTEIMIAGLAVGGLMFFGIVASSLAAFKTAAPMAIKLLPAAI